MTEIATYDCLSRRTGVTKPDNTLAYTLDPRGNLTAANDNDSGVSFAYDARNRLATTTTDGTVGPQPAVTLTYAYDALDRRLSVSDSLGGPNAYAWNVEDRLSDLTPSWGTVYTFGYDGEGRRTSLSSTSGRNSTMGSGCAECQTAGRKGWVLVSELLQASDALEVAISAGAPGRTTIYSGHKRVGLSSRR